MPELITRKPVAIIGGGISGLSAAYYLSKAGVPAVLFEKAPQLGGVIQTHQVEGCRNYRIER